MAQFKVKRKKVKSSLPKLSSINELSICVFIVKKRLEESLRKRINELSGRIVSVMQGVGVSRTTAFSSIKIGTDDVSVFITAVRDEDAGKFIKTIAKEFRLDKPGQGKGFIVEADGYLGAKALFIGE